MENTNIITVVNPACEELTNKIKVSMYRVAKEFVYIGFLLAECEYLESYKEWGYSSIHEYASDQLGFKKSSTYNFINVCKSFCLPSENFSFSYLMKEPYSRFNYSQLVEMLSMDDKMRSQVTPDMSVKQIRELKKTQPGINFAELFNMQFRFKEFSYVYTSKINGKKFTLKIKGVKCEVSDIWPDGYFLSFSAEYHTSGSSAPFNRIVDYEKFKDQVNYYLHLYDDDSRRLEDEHVEPSSTPSAPAADVDYIVPTESDLRVLFDDIDNAALFNDAYDGKDLYDVVVDYFNNKGYVILKKCK